jgi:organic radical activating enzyme
MLTQNADRDIHPADYKQFGDEWLLVHGVFGTIQGEGPFVGEPAVFVRLAGCNYGSKTHFCAFCFPENYAVNTKRGSVKLKDIKIGDKVLTLDDDLNPTFTTVKKKLTRSVPRSDMVLIKYEEDGVKRKLQCTKDHPFHVKGKGFIRAEDLKEGQILYHVNKNYMSSYNKKHIDNPMWDKEIAKKVGRTNKFNYESGENIPYKRIKKWRENQAKNMRDKNPMWDPEVVKKNMASHWHEMSKLEIKFKNLFDKIGVPVIFAGDGETAIGNKALRYKLPDFIVRGTKKIVEVYDKSYPFYKEKRHTKTGDSDYRSGKRKLYKKFGYEVLFLTQQSIFDSRNPAKKLKTAMGNFLANGATVISVREFKKSNKKHTGGRVGKGVYKLGNRWRAMIRLDTKLVHLGVFDSYEEAKKVYLVEKKKQYPKLEKVEAPRIKVVNLSCEPYNTFCMERLHTHNCDTSFHIDNGVPNTYDTLMQRIESEAASKLNSHTKLIIITGGEPTIQPNLAKFVLQMLDDDWTVQIETNGTHLTSFVEKLFEISNDVPNLYVVISPKASKNGYGKVFRDVDNIPNWIKLCLKFVVDNDSESVQHELPDWVELWHQQYDIPVFISPMTIYKKPYTGEIASAWDGDLIDQPRTRANHKYAAGLCMKHGYRLSLQQQIFVEIA